MISKRFQKNLDSTYFQYILKIRKSRNINLIFTNWCIDDFIKKERKKDPFNQLQTIRKIFEQTYITSIHISKLHHLRNSFPNVPNHITPRSPPATSPNPNMSERKQASEQLGNESKGHASCPRLRQYLT